MQVGDLVTLSAYAIGLDTIPRRLSFPYLEEYVEPIGVVVRIEKRKHLGVWASENERHEFHVKWCGEGPRGRQHYTKYFFRKDLKHVR